MGKRFHYTDKDIRKKEEHNSLSCPHLDYCKTRKDVELFHNTRTKHKTAIHNRSNRKNEPITTESPYKTGYSQIAAISPAEFGRILGGP